MHAEPTLAGQLPPRWHKPLTTAARFCSLFVLLLFLPAIVYNYGLGTNPCWKSGGLKACDLSQHYAGGQFWKEGRVEDLYRNYQLGDWMTSWQKSIVSTEDKLKVERFNYVYSPLVAWFSSIFTGLPFGIWACFWLYLGFAVYAACYRLMALADPGGCYTTHMPVIWFAGFPSFYFALILGQNTMLTLVILLASGLMLNQNRSWLAGLIMSCAFYKPQLMVYTGFFMLLAGDWRFCAAIGLGSVSWLLLGIWQTGWAAHQLWFESLRHMSSGGQFQKLGLNQSWRGFLLSCSGGKTWGETPATLLSLLSLALPALWIRTGSKKINWQPAYTLYLALTAWLLACPYVGYYELLLGLPWWMVLLVRFRWNRIELGLLCLYWLTGALSILGLRMQCSLSAPFLLLWLLGSMAQMLRPPGFRTGKYSG